MTALGQQSLLEVPPAREWVVPAGFEHCWWGIDSSTKAYNIGYVSRREDGQLVRGVHSVKLGAANDHEGERLARFGRQLRQLILAMLDAGVPVPGVVFVEQASGASPKPILWYTVGVACEATYSTLNRRCGFVPRVETVPSSTWKKTACGRGNIYKPKRGDTEEYGVLSWAKREAGYTGDSWDDADALAIAEAARRTIAIRG